MTVSVTFFVGCGDARTDDVFLINWTEKPATTVAVTSTKARAQQITFFNT
jgi:hypothetical protein